LTLSKLKASYKLQATKVFTNREAALNTFKRHLNKYQSHCGLFKVVAFYGVGGIGKSELFKKLQSQLGDYEGVKSVKIDLGSASCSSQLDFLLNLRISLNVNCESFDYAVAQFLALHGRSLNDIKSSSIPDNSILYDLQDVAAGIIGTVAPARLIKKIYDRADQSIKAKIGKNKVDFDRIDNMSQEEVQCMLPVFLGEAIEKANKHKSKKFVFFIDSVESLKTQSFYRKTKEQHDGWLAELIASSEAGLWFIGSRDKLKWEEENNNWSEVLEQHILGPLSDVDSDFFLSRIPIKEDNIRSRIVKAAHGVPLFLDLLANTYLIRKNEHKSINESDFSLQSSEVVNRFIKHLDNEHQEVLKILSPLSVFNFSLFERIVKAFNIKFPMTLFDEFCSTSYVESMDGEKFKLNRLLRQFISIKLTDKLASLILEQVCIEIEESIAKSVVIESLWLNSVLIDFLDTHHHLNLHFDIGILFHSMLYCIESGLWLEIYALLDKQHIEGIFERNPQSKFIFGFILAVIERKKGNLSKANILFSNIENLVKYIGDHKIVKTYQYYFAHLRHLRGEYESSARTYRTLFTTASNDKDQYALLANRQYCDIQMLQGRFKEALSGFSSLISKSNLLWNAEIFRFQGHIYRFNFLFDQANADYEKAMQISKSLNADAMVGRILNNMTETYCWQSPEKSIQYGKEAIEINADLGNKIEVGKTYAALSIAYSKLGEKNMSETSYQKAIDIQQKTGYRSGSLFALHAKAWQLTFFEDFKSREKVILEMSMLSNELNVYKFLLYPFQSARNIPPSLLEEIQWLNTPPSINGHNI